MRSEMRKSKYTSEPELPTQTREQEQSARGESASGADGDRILNEQTPTWYKDAIIYQLHVKSFFDSNNDGIGDFPGLIDKLDYIASLGVNTIWLLPFYPSPLRDDGYDIADYYGVHPDYGSVDDVQNFIDAAHERGLRIITELVINHTSDQHPWFKAARKALTGSPEREFYVWSDTDEKYTGTRIIFLDTEHSNWTWDPEAKAYFWHRFYSHQPDLNFDNPAVLDAVLKVMNYWLNLGVDGLRLDAVPYLVEREGTNNENLPETHDILKRIRAEVDASHPGCLLLAEANQWPEDTQQYFGDGDECHMAFHFPLMPRMYMALAQEDRFPITDILRQTPTIPENCQWAIFLRNHDELTLEMVTDKERDYLWNQYASESRARINLGIRRRLAPLMQRDRRRVELLNSLLLTMPGTPVIYYGDEIGMGDNIYLGDRDGVRTPMQWSPDRNGGFSRADPPRLMLPAIMDPLYGYGAVNVEAQSRDPHSMLNWTRAMLEVRQRYQAFGRGSFKMLYPANRRVLAYVREFAEATEDASTETILCLANVSRSAQAVELDLSAYAGFVPLELSGGSLFPPIGELNYLLTLPPFGFYWFLLADKTVYPEWYTPPPEPLPDFVTLVLRRGIGDVVAEPLKSTLEKDIIPAYLAKRRWFAGKDQTLQEVELAQFTELPAAQPAQRVLLTEYNVQVGNQSHRYQIPLIMFDEDQVNALAHQLALARVRHTRRVGLLTDAVATDYMTRNMLRQLLASAAAGEVIASKGKLNFSGTRALAFAKLDEDEVDIRTLSAEQSNSSIIIGERAVLKLLRRLFTGDHPEVTMSGLLTEGGFKNTAPLFGHVYRVDENEQKTTLAVLQGYIPNQGNGWEWMLEHLERLHQELGALQPAEATAAEVAANISEKQDEYLRQFAQFAQAIGQRLGEMHHVLATASDQPEFVAETAGRSAWEQWAENVQQQFSASLVHLRQVQALADADKARAQAILAHEDSVNAKISELAHAGQGSLMFRIHGDLHLGQILVSQDDAYFIDFEGEPARPLQERAQKASPFKDVAGMLRSFQYVADTAAKAHSVVGNEQANGLFDEFLAVFQHRCERVFLEAYFTRTDAIGHRWQDHQAAMALVHLFAIEKAAYEIVYEATNRPEWLATPLAGLFGLLQALDLPLGGAPVR